MLGHSQNRGESAMGNITLLFDGDTIKRQDDLGNISSINADDIFEWVFENGRDPGDGSLTSRPEEAFRDMTFSRFPLTPVIEISADTQSESMNLSVNFSLKLEEIVFVVPDFLRRDSDHIVHNMIWYPFTKGSQDAIRELLGRLKYENNSTITLKQYLEI
mgnify:CR=1 FL=1